MLRKQQRISILLYEQIDSFTFVANENLIQHMSNTTLLLLMFSVCLSLIFCTLVGTCWYIPEPGSLLMTRVIFPVLFQYHRLVQLP